MLSQPFAEALLAKGAMAVPGNVWHLSRDPRGCRAVQSALEEASTDKEREALAGELRGNCDRAARCPHANHVLQKIVVKLRPQSLQFVIDEIVEAGVLQVARHKYGCRVIQRLIEHCEELQVQEVIGDLLRNFRLLAKRPYSNYVLQHMLQYGSEVVQTKAMNIVGGSVLELGSD